MKRILSYKLYENNSTVSDIDDINDIFMELRDSGYNVTVTPKSTKFYQFYTIKINKTDKKYGYDMEGNFNFAQPFLLSEIIDDVERLLLSLNGKGKIILYNVELYNKYENNKMIKYNHSLLGSESTWDQFIEIIKNEFGGDSKSGLDTKLNNIELLLVLQH